MEYCPTDRLNEMTQHLQKEKENLDKLLGVSEISCPMAGIKWAQVCKETLQINICTHHRGLPWWLSGKESACSAGHAGDTSSTPEEGEPLEGEMATHSSSLAWETAWTEEPGGLQSMESQRVRLDSATKQQQHRRRRKGEKRQNMEENSSWGGNLTAQASPRNERAQQ